MQWRARSGRPQPLAGDELLAAKSDEMKKKGRASRKASQKATKDEARMARRAQWTAEDEAERERVRKALQARLEAAQKPAQEALEELNAQNQAGRQQVSGVIIAAQQGRENPIWDFKTVQGGAAAVQDFNYKIAADRLKKIAAGDKAAEAMMKREQRLVDEALNVHLNAMEDYEIKIERARAVGNAQKEYDLAEKRQGHYEAYHALEKRLYAVTGNRRSTRSSGERSDGGRPPRRTDEFLIPGYEDGGSLHSSAATREYARWPPVGPDRPRLRARCIQYLWTRRLAPRVGEKECAQGSSAEAHVCEAAGRDAEGDGRDEGQDVHAGRPHPRAQRIGQKILFWHEDARPQVACSGLWLAATAVGHQGHFNVRRHHRAVDLRRSSWGRSKGARPPSGQRPLFAQRAYPQRPGSERPLCGQPALPARRRPPPQTRETGCTRIS